MMYQTLQDTQRRSLGFGLVLDGWKIGVAVMDASSDGMDSKNLLTPPSQYPVALFSVAVVCNKVLHGLHL